MHIGHWTKCGLRVIALVALCASGTVTADDGKRLYRWTDSEGNAHYGDRVPPEHAERGYAVLNEHGVEIDRVTGTLSDEERAARDAAAAREEREREARERAALRDKVLLSTYLSVEEIEALRDRRIELISGQIRITQRYLDNLREKLVKLEKEAQRYSPYSPDPDAEPIDEKLAREFSNTLNSILLYEKTLANARAEQEQIMEKFAADIRRFRELKGVAQNR